MRLLLAAHGPRFATVGVEQAGLLLDLAAVLENFDLAPCLVFDGAHHEPHRIDVLDLAARAQSLARTTHRDVDVAAQAALLHIAVAGADVAQDRTHLAQVDAGLLGGSYVGLGDDLHQGDAGAIEIDERRVRVAVVQALARVLLEVEARDADVARRAVGQVDDDRAMADNRLAELGDLIARRQIGIEIVLAVEHREAVDLGLEGEPGAHRLLDTDLVDHRQHAGHGGVDEADLAVGRGPERRAGAREQLRLRDHLGVDLEADDRLPIAGPALDERAFLHIPLHPRPRPGD